MMDVISIAEICHEANRLWCEGLGDVSQPIWSKAPAWQKRSAISGVRLLVENPKATPEDSHKSWLAHKEAEGWTYGETKDEVKLTHPCMVPYDELPNEQRAKDTIFHGIVRACLKANAEA
jgi:hypothetical protein